MTKAICRLTTLLSIAFVFQTFGMESSVDTDERPLCCSPRKTTRYESPYSHDSSKLTRLLRLLEESRMMASPRDEQPYFNAGSPARSQSTDTSESSDELIEHTDDLEHPVGEHCSPGVQSATSRGSSLSWGLSSSRSYDQLQTASPRKRMRVTPPYLASTCCLPWNNDEEDVERPDSPFELLSDNE